MERDGGRGPCGALGRCGVEDACNSPPTHHPVLSRAQFFSKAPTDATEEQIAAFFTQWGAVEEINLFRERRTGVSKGCGFVTMQVREGWARAGRERGRDPYQLLLGAGVVTM